MSEAKSEPTVFTVCHVPYFDVLRPFALNDRQRKIREVILKPRSLGFSRMIADLVRASTLPLTP